MVAHDASSVMSAAYPVASPPSSRIMATVSSADARSRSTMRTRAPSRANRIDVARPFPMVAPGVCPPPTTTATRPASRSPMCSLSHGSDRSGDDLGHAEPTEVTGLEAGAVPDGDAQEGEAPTVRVAAQAVLIGADQQEAVHDLEEVGERRGRVAIDLDLHVGADVAGHVTVGRRIGGADVEV